MPTIIRSACAGIFLILLTACTSIMPNTSTKAPHTPAFIQSNNDAREYRTLTLNNQLQVLLISEADADKAAAAMNVSVGSGSDPKNFAGLAHFLEHMLFLGTEKYPESGEYQSFISKHGGNHNAFTSYEDTNYFFEIESAYLSPALDRFSQFFTAPLFSEEYVNREKNAVHSEYQSKLRDDGRRQFDILKQALNPDHPYSKFSTGSLETLSDKEISAREAMLDFYQQHYSANQMSLVILGRESLDELEQIAERFFSAIPNRNIASKVVQQPLFAKDSLPKQLNIKPLKARHELRLQFPMPSTTYLYKEKPASYIASLIGHEGEGSLLSYLKAQGWATGLSAGSGISTKEEALFSIGINLTEPGVNAREEIINATFSYINLIQTQGINKWRFDEQKALSEQEFNFVEQGAAIHYVSTLAYNMSRYPSHEVVHAAYAMENFDPLLIQRYLSYLKPDNMLVTLVSPDIKTNKTSPWFGGEYALETFDSSKIAPTQLDVLKLPEPNPFIAKNLHLKADSNHSDTPINISTSPFYSLWFKHDTDFGTPKAQQYISLQTPISSSNVRSAVLTQMLSSWLSDASNEFAYPARLAGLDYSVYKHMRGLTFQLGGYDEQQPALLERLLQILSKEEISQERFDLVKQSLIKRWKNADKAPLYQQVSSQVSNLLQQPNWQEPELLSTINRLQLQDLVEFRTAFLQQLYIDSMVTGNLTADEARQSLKMVVEYLKPSLSKEAVPSMSILSLDQQHLQHYPEIEHNDNAYLHYYQGNSHSIETQAQWLLLAQILQSPYYQEMRTQQQLGYIVFASYHPVLNMPGLSLLVQSPTHSPEDIQQRSQRFLESFAEKLHTMPSTTWEEQKAGLIGNLLEKDDNLQSRTQRFWREMALEYTNFDRAAQLARAVQTLELSTIVQLFETQIMQGNAGQFEVSYQPKSKTFTDVKTLSAQLKPIAKH